PWPLRLVRPARATVFTAWFPHTSFGSSYSEAGVFFHLRNGAIHCPWMIVDDDVALIVGRELLGYPKKLGDIELAIEGERIRGVASRRGSTLLRMEGRLGARAAGAPPILGRPHRNVRALLGVALPTLVAFTPREEAIEVRDVELSLEVGGSARDPLHEMGLGQVRAARLHRVNLRAGGVPLPIGLVSPLGCVAQTLVRTH
ncbi:MAG: acetoacetate decarboxylase family protein, partial [Polyangia bacterium]